MNKKYIFVLILALMFSLLVTDKVYAAGVMPQKDANVSITVQADDEDCDEVELIKRFSLKNKFKKSPESQIKDFFKRYNRYSAKNRIDKLKELYTDDYVNNDGFDKKTVFEMMNMASSAYKNVYYTTDIESIEVDGNYAVVRAKEVATGETEKVFEKVNDTGSINSELRFVDYMKKEGNNWKISATEVIFEKVILAYGEAKSLPVNISAPDCVPEGANYEVSVRTTSPDHSFLVASISNDKIVFPQEQGKDVYRAIKKDELARILTANKTNNNEYATVSIALTRAQVEPESVVLNMTGIAFIMKRVNVLPLNKNVNLNKESLNAKTNAQ